MEIITIEPQIYTYDIDSNHHVSNITYIKWMEIGRIKLLEEIGMPIHEIEKQGFAPALTRTEITYKKPLYLGDKVRVDLYLTKLRKTSACMKFKFVKDEDEVVAEGEKDGVFFTLDTKRVYRLSDEQRQLFAIYLLEG